MLLTEGEQEEESKPLPIVPESSKGEIGGQPPPYEAASAGTSTPEPSAPLQSPRSRTNYTQVVSPNRSIDTTWNIDLSLPPLSHLASSRSSPGHFLTHDRSRPNVFLWSEHQAVKASINVLDSSVAGPSTPKRAFMVAQAGNNVVLEIASRAPSTRLHICVESMNGNIIVRLPKDFTGPIKCRSDRLLANPSLVRFTPRVKENTTELSQEETEVYAFVGDGTQAHLSEPVSSHSTGMNAESPSFPSPVTTTQGFPLNTAPALYTWQGDQIEAIANNGRIKICYALTEGEEKESEGELNTLVRHVQESGPIAALVKFAARGVMKGIQSSKKKNEADRSKQ